MTDIMYPTIAYCKKYMQRILLSIMIAFVNLPSKPKDNANRTPCWFIAIERISPRSILQESSKWWDVGHRECLMQSYY